MNKNTLVKPDLSKMHNAEFSQFLTRFFEDFAGSGIALDTDTTFQIALRKPQDQSNHLRQGSGTGAWQRGI